MSGLTVGFAFPPHGLFLHHRHASPVHLHIQDRNGIADDDRQVQLYGPLDLLLLALCSIFAYRFRRALHRLGGELQASQEFHLLASMIERNLLTHQRQHAAHAGREFRILEIQFDIGGKLSHMTLRTQVIRPRNARWSEHGENRLGAKSLILRLVTAAARQLALLPSRGLVMQQLTQAGCAGLMKSRPKSVLHGFQIHLAAETTLGKDTAQ
jgi:hypothetical protein